MKTKTTCYMVKLPFKNHLFSVKRAEGGKVFQNNITTKVNSLPGSLELSLMLQRSKPRPKRTGSVCGYIVR